MLFQIHQTLVGQDGAIVLSMVSRAHVDDLHGNGATRRDCSATGECPVVESTDVGNLVACWGAAILASRAVWSLIAFEVCRSAAIHCRHWIGSRPWGTEAFADVLR